MGAIASKAQYERVLRYIEKAKAEGARLVCGGKRPAGAAFGQGFFLEPTIFDDVRPDMRIAREEIFGPVLSVETVQSIEHACDLVDASNFALTGGLFSRSPRTIEYVTDRTPVGNLYVNREITGAMVGRQPFGGGKLSGTGPKAGGPDYLLQFVEARAVTENTVRHGLVV